MRSFKRGLLSGYALFAAWTIFPSDGEAAGFYVRENSTSAQMTGFAGAASQGTDSSHLFYNPATITKNAGSLACEQFPFGEACSEVSCSRYSAIWLRYDPHAQILASNI